MADEALRMQAEVVDRFSGPLKALRAQLLDTGREGAKHGEALAKGLNKAEAAAQQTAATAKTVLNPAFAALGVTGLGAGVAVAGIAAALNNLSGNLSSLGQLGRETSMAADQLRIFQSVASKFGVSGDASSAAAKTFSQNMRDIRRGVGETMGFLQSQNQVVAQFAIKLKGTTNNDEALKMTEEFLEQIPNAVDRGRFAEKLFGNMDLGRLGDKHLGAIKDLNAKTAEKIGPLDPAAVTSAERYERAMDDLRSSMTRIGTTIAMELLPPAERFTTWLDEIASGKRKDMIDGIRSGMREIGAELGKIDWKSAGESAKDMLLSTTSLVKPLAESVREIAAAIRSFNEGNYIESFRHLDGGSGPLARRLAPMRGDDEINVSENVDRLRKLRDLSNEASGHLIGRTQQSMGLMDTPEAAQRKLDAAEAELTRLKARTPEQRQKDYEQATERLRRSVDGLSEQLRQQQNGKDATAQKSSLDADELFGGARIQAASLGGARIFGGPGGYGAFPEGSRGEMREAFRRYLMRKVPGYDGGAMVPTGPDGRIPGLGSGGGSQRLPGIGGGGTPLGSDAGNLSSLIEREARAAGIDPRIMEGIRAGESGHRHNRDNPAAAYDKKDDALESSWGPFQLNRRRGLGVQFEKETGLDVRDPKTIASQVRWIAQGLAKNGRGWLRNWMGYHGDRNADPRWGDSGYVPSGSGATARLPSASEGDFLPNGAPRVLKPNSMKDAPGLTMEDANRLRSGQADGAGWAAREKARKAYETMQQGEGRLDAAAGRAGVVGGTKVEANGSVSVVVQRPGPDTNVRTSASGNLFRDVVLSRGRTMAPAGGG